MCSLVTRSCCISLETHLVLNSEYIGPFYFFFLCYCCPCWCFLQIDWCSSSYICLENLLFCIHSLGDDQCVDVMNKKLVIDVFGVLHLFLSCCTALLVKGAACQLESYMYDYIYEGKRNFGPFTCLVHCVTHGASCSIPQVFCPSHRHTGHHPAKMYTEQEIFQTHLLHVCSCLNINQSAGNISKDNSNTEKK